MHSVTSRTRTSPSSSSASTAASDRCARPRPARSTSRARRRNRSSTRSRTAPKEAGGFADVMTRIVLKKAGIDPKDVTFVTTTTAGRVQALATGQTDTAVLHIDQVKTVQKQTPTISVLANMWELLSDYQYSVYIVPTQTLKDDPSTTECIVRALMRANRAMYDSANKQKVVDIAVKEGKIDATIAADTFDILVKAKAWPQNEGLLKANIEGTIKSEKDFGKITKDLKFEDVTDLTIAKKVVDQLGRVKDFPY
ncbi:MAG: ABC transporter substrate-binding protein [Chloroflexi bacterium]|nr:MAG: ABC transporter substrate-binding protein [Chloroflexota bacterium]